MVGRADLGSGGHPGRCRYETPITYHYWLCNCGVEVISISLRTATLLLWYLKLVREIPGYLAMGYIHLVGCCGLRFSPSDIRGLRWHDKRIYQTLTMVALHTEQHGLQMVRPRMVCCKCLNSKMLDIYHSPPFTYHSRSQHNLLCFLRAEQSFIFLSSLLSVLHAS